MPIIYVDSNATGANNGTSWTDAYTTIQAALTAWTNSDEIWVEDSHNEGTATVTWTATNDSLADRVPIYRMTSANVYSPTTGADTKQYDASDGGADINIQCSCSWNGVYFSVDDNIVSNTSAVSGAYQDCVFDLATSNSVFTLGSGVCDSPDVFKDCTINFTNVSGGWIACEGGQLVFSHSTFTGWASAGLFRLATGRYCSVLLNSCDISDSTNPVIDVSASTDCGFLVRLLNCDINASASIHDNGFSNDDQFIYVENTDDSGQLYQNAKYCFRGDVTTDTGVYYGGTDAYQDADGTTSLSMKMAPASNVDIASPLESLDIVARITSTGAKTFTVECVENYTTALTKREAWIEVQYLGSAAETIFSMADDREFAASSYTNLAAGSGLGDWTSEPAGSRSVKLTASATVNQAGLYRVRVFLAKYEASKVLYYNPAVTVASVA